MTASDFRAALARLELTQRGFARLCGCNERTVRRWANGVQDVPGWVPLMLRLLAVYKANYDEWERTLDAEWMDGLIVD